MTPEERFRISVPKNMPEHGWPRFPDFDRYPDLRDKPPAWWHWFRLEPMGPTGGRVIEVAGTTGYDANDPWGVHSGHPLQFVREVMRGSFESARAAFRLLKGACALDSSRNGDEGSKSQ
jgi:hypothetical protein